MSLPHIAAARITPASSGAGNETGTPALVFTPEDGRAEPTYFIHPVAETDDAGRRTRHHVVRDPAIYARVAHPSGNPNVFVRRDDPHFALAAVVPMSPLPDVGHVILRDGNAYEILTVDPDGDAVMLVAVCGNPDAVPGRITLKADDLVPSGTLPGGLTLWK